MGAILLLTALGLLALPGALRALGNRMAPSEWARLCVTALVAGGVIFEAAAFLYSLPTLLRAANAPVLAEACDRMLGGLTPGGKPAGWTAAAVTVLAATLAARGIWNARRSHRIVRVESWLGHHSRYRGYDLVQLPTSEVVALSVDGAQPQILVSDGLVAAVAPNELQLILRHEAVHLDNHHQRYLLVATALEHGFAFIPFVRRSTATMRLALERWADEGAVGNNVHRRRQLRDTLLVVVGAGLEPGLAGFSAADSIVERIRALEARAAVKERHHFLLYTPGAALGVIACVSLGAWIGGARMVLAMSGHCQM